MNCEEFKKLIVSLAYDELSKMEAESVQRHLSECQECAKFKSEIAKTSNLLDNWVDREIPVDLANLLSQVERKPIVGRLLWQKRWFAWTATAFGIVAILLTVFGLIGTEIKWHQNSLTVSFGGKPDIQNELASTAVLQTQYQSLSAELSEELQIAMAQLLRVILEHQESQKVQLSMLIEAIQTQRNSDMKLIKEEIQNMANAIDDELQKAYLTLDWLITAQANTQTSETEQSKSEL